MSVDAAHQAGFGENCQMTKRRPVERALDDLVRMGCLKQSRNDPERGWLREWVRIKY